MFKAKKCFGFLPILMMVSVFVTLMTSQAAKLSRQPIKEGQVMANVANLTSPDAQATSRGDLEEAATTSAPRASVITSNTMPAAATMALRGPMLTPICKTP